MPQGMGGVWSATALIFFAYLGFDELGNLAEETKRPERTLPLALFVAMLVSSVIYITVSISAVSTVGWMDLSQSSAPLADVAAKAIGSRADVLLWYVALAATSNTVLLLMVSASRSLHGMASSGVLPEWLLKVGFRKTPWLAISATTLATGLFIALGDLETVARMTNAVVLISFTLVNVSLFVWMIKTQKSGRSLLKDFLPPLLGAGTCLWLISYTGIAAVGLALLVAASGLVISLRPSFSDNPKKTQSKE